MKKSIIFLTILFITIISACNDNKWNSIKENATINSIQNFIDNNPENEHIQEAERILDSLLTIDSLNWRNALKENNIDSFYKYIEKNPEGKFIEKANKNIDFLKLIETNKKKQKTKDSLISIIKKYIIPNEETLGSGDWYPVWQKVIAKNNQSDYLSFLKTFQNSDNWSKAAAIIIYGTEYKDIVIKTFDFIVEMTENPSPENLSNFTKKPISVDKFCDDNLDKIEYFYPKEGFESEFIESEDEYYIVPPYELDNIEFTSPNKAHIFHSVTNESPSEYKYNFYLEIINGKLIVTNYKLEETQYWGDEENY